MTVTEVQTDYPIQWERVPEHMRRLHTLRQVQDILDHMACSLCNGFLMVITSRLTKTKHPNGVLAKLTATVTCKGCGVQPKEVSTVFAMERKGEGLVRVS